MEWYFGSGCCRRIRKLLRSEKRSRRFEKNGGFFKFFAKVLFGQYGDFLRFAKRRYAVLAKKKGLYGIAAFEDKP